MNAIKKAIRTNSIIVPAISLWEISMLVATHRISLHENTLNWLKSATSAPGISVYPLSPEVAYESTALPDDFHGDPADRIIVATTRVLGGTLLTFDEEIIRYSKSGHVRVLKHRHIGRPKRGVKM